MHLDALGFQGGELVGGHGLTEEEALRERTAELTNPPELLEALEALGDRHHAERAGEADHRLHDRAGRWLVDRT